jgi:hypothetical protein
LVAAKQRGVNVRVILDRDNALSSWNQAIKLVPENIPIHGTPYGEVARHSFLIADRRSAADGNLLWEQSRVQDKSASLRVLRNEPSGVASLTAEFDRMWNDRRYTDLMAPSSGAAPTVAYELVSAERLFAAYESNKISADLKWYGARVRVSGEIWGVEESKGGPIVSLRVSEWVGGWVAPTVPI